MTKSFQKERIGLCYMHQSHAAKRGYDKIFKEAQMHDFNITGWPERLA